MIHKDSDLKINFNYQTMLNKAYADEDVETDDSILDAGIERTVADLQYALKYK